MNGRYLEDVYIRVRMDILENRAEVFITHERGDGSGPVMAGPVTFDGSAEASWDTSPSLMIDKAAMQVLFDDLWRAGFRPADYAGEGVIKAMQAHIDTLRQVLKFA